jgi:hypothetical protein
VSTASLVVPAAHESRTISLPNELTVTDLPHIQVGDRLMAHPATHTWLSGDRYGTVTSVGRSSVTLRMDKTGRSLRFHPVNLCQPRT